MLAATCSLQKHAESSMHKQQLSGATRQARGACTCAQLRASLTCCSGHASAVRTCTVCTLDTQAFVRLPFGP